MIRTMTHGDTHSCTKTSVARVSVESKNSGATKIMAQHDLRQNAPSFQGVRHLRLGEMDRGQVAAGKVCSDCDPMRLHRMEVDHGELDSPSDSDNGALTPMHADEDFSQGELEGTQSNAWESDRIDETGELWT